MGTTWSLTARSLPKEAREVVQGHLDAREAVLSHWRSDSALSRFNASPGGEWFAVPEVLVRAVEAAHAVARETEGALDITLAPVIDLWGFGADDEARVVPSQAEIDSGLANTGWERLHWRAEPPALRKDLPELRINVAAVAEGLVLDEVVAILKRCGLTNFLLEIGGEAAAVGGAPDGQPWRVGVQMPEGKPGETIQALTLRDQCIATSGNYRHRYFLDGVAYSHLIDPRTGRPIRHGLASVSVVDASCARADGFATALMILGPERGREVARRLGLRVIWVEDQGGRRE